MGQQWHTLNLIMMTIQLNQIQTSNSGAGFMSALMGKGVNVNVAVLGVDEGETRTDVIFVVHF